MPSPVQDQPEYSGAAATKDPAAAFNLALWDQSSRSTNRDSSLFPRDKRNRALGTISRLEKGHLEHFQVGTGH